MNYLELIELIEKHEQELYDLRDNCSHDPSKLIFRYDWSCVGCESSTPSIHIVCPNCGKMKVMFRNYKEEFLVKIERTLEKQAGIEDQRLDTYIQYDQELRPSKTETFETVNEEIEKLINPKPTKEFTIWESSKGVLHGTPPKGQC